MTTQLILQTCSESIYRILNPYSLELTIMRANITILEVVFHKDNLRDTPVILVTKRQNTRHALGDANS